MKPTLNVVRAIGVEFARRMLRPLIIVGILTSIVLLSIGGWLAAQNAWWWIVEAICIIGTIVFIGLVLVARIALRVAEPALNKTQRQSVSVFVDKLERVAENIQTPQIVILYYVIRDTIRPRPDSFIETISRDSKTLAPDFVNLRKHFTSEA